MRQSAPSSGTMRRVRRELNPAACPLERRCAAREPPAEAGRRERPWQAIWRNGSTRWRRRFRPGLWRPTGSSPRCPAIRAPPHELPDDARRRGACPATVSSWETEASVRRTPLACRGCSARCWPPKAFPFWRTEGSTWQPAAGRDLSKRNRNCKSFFKGLAQIRNQIQNFTITDPIPIFDCRLVLDEGGRFVFCFGDNSVFSRPFDCMIVDKCSKSSGKQGGAVDNLVDDVENPLFEQICAMMYKTDASAVFPPKSSG